MKPFALKWLVGYNKKIQTKYWKIIKESNWKKYHIPLTIKGIDSIIEYTLIDNPDFNELDKITEQIESKTLCFIIDVEKFFPGNQTNL